MATAAELDEEQPVNIGSTADEARDEYGAVDMREVLTLKADHESRPIYVTPDGRVFLETHSPIYRQAYDFLIAIAEPLCRPEDVHEYVITPYSLYAAASVGLRTEKIIETLQKFSKTELPEAVVRDIRACTQRYGKVKLVLRNARYYIESSDPEALQALLRDPVVREARVVVGEGDEGLTTVASSREAARAADLQIAGMAATEAARRRQQEAAAAAVADEDLSDEALIAAMESAERITALPEDLQGVVNMIDGEDEDKLVESNTVFFEIKREMVQKVQQQCSPNFLDYPLLDEYDFRQDPNLPNIDIDLKPTCILRPYQEKSLRKMFGSQRARSGIIVLPCGAGKTLTGVTAVSTIKKRAIVLCTSNVSVEQWRNEFKRWCDVNERIVCRFTSEDKTIPPPDCIICCTYTMLAAKTNRAEETQRMIDYLQSREWGIMILDEVQTVPAKEFRQLLTKIPAKCKLGLTATLVREDGRIEDLRFLVGPKLYEANWIDLQEAGHIARVQCVQVWCEMTPAFYREYWKADVPHNLRLQLCRCNPNKFIACEFLIREHERRGDKIIVFSDDVFALQTLASRLEKELIYGATPEKQRHEILDRYRRFQSFQTIFFSKVADNAFDLPEANVLIQITSLGGSRRQEAQRLGRILRAKKGPKPKPGEYNAFFYSLVSKDTVEMSYATRRQRFLVDQGYAYKVLTNLQGLELEGQVRPFKYDDELEQRQLLCAILAEKLKAAAGEDGMEDDEDLLGTGGMVRTMASMSAYTGADDMVYKEYRRVNTAPAAKRHRLFKQRFMPAKAF